MKTCPKCGVAKSFDDFYRDRTRPDGVGGWCKTCHNVGTRAWRRTPAGRDYDRAGWLRRAYGLSVTDYAGLLDAQGGRCAICRDPFEHRRPHVDHNHETGAVRGLLCGPCNTSLGGFRDDPDRLRAALDYLQQTDRKALATA